jgi:diadenosine tetraphosphate (Ap4A) HIT family hydrolase
MTIKEHVELAQKNQNPLSIFKLKSGWVIAGPTQPLQGYCMMIADPIVKSLNDLPPHQRAQYALDTALVGDALIKVMKALRVNYEIWGNVDPTLHTHITPRYLSEPDLLRKGQPRVSYDWDRSRPFDLKLDQEWVIKVREYLKEHSFDLGLSLL